MSMIVFAALLVAQENPLTRKPADNVPLASDEVRRLGVHYGDCVVREEPELARTYVLKDPQTQQAANGVQTVADAIERIKENADKTVEKLSIGACLIRPSDQFKEVGMRFTGDTMRYVLADALFRRNLASRPPLTRLDQVPVLAQSATINRFGECIVRQNPQGAHALLVTGVLKPEENAAFSALKPTMGTCLAADSTVTLNKMMLRGSIAYNYVRLANAPRQAAPGNSAK